MPFRAMVDACFARLGVGAVYTPQGGGAIAVTVIGRRPDQVVGFDDTRLYTGTSVFDVRASEVASPRPGDTIVVDGAIFVVQGEPVRNDPDRLVWTLDVRPA